MINTDNTVRIAIGFFVIILCGGLLSALIGGGFAALIAVVSPEFIYSLFNPGDKTPVVSYAFAVGMIWGLFIGAGASAFACSLAAILKILKVRFEFRRGDQGQHE